MTPEAQRIAIAEACGWYWTGTMWACPDGSGFLCAAWAGDLPDYLNDLNAMHEAERLLDGDHVATYVSMLEGFHDEPKLSWVISENDINLAREAAFGLIHATAAQRCEAFLRTLGLWEETQL